MEVLPGARCVLLRRAAFPTLLKSAAAQHAPRTALPAAQRRHQHQAPVHSAVPQSLDIACAQA